MQPAPVARRWPWAVAAAGPLLSLAALPPAVEHAREAGLADVYVVDALVGATVPLAGALILSRSRHRVGAVLLSTAGLALGFCLASYGRGGHSGGHDWAVWASNLAWIPFLGLLTLLPLWFPTGRAPGRGWLPVQWAVLALLAAVALAHAFAARLTDGRPSPLGLTLPEGTDGVARGLVVATVVSSIACAAGAAWRYRGAGEADRRRLRGFVVAVAVTVAVMFVPGLPVAVSDVVVALALGLVATTAAGAVLDRGTLGVGVWVDRSLAVAVATAVLLALYAGTGALGAALAPDAAALVAAAVVAAAVAPVHALATRAVDRALHGYRSDPLGAIAAVGAEAVTASGDVDLAAAAEAVARSLRLPHVAVVDARGRRGEAGRPDPGAGVTELWPLSDRGTGLGAVAITLRPGEHALHHRDRDLLAALTRSVASALRVEGLAGDLAASRTRIVAAREEERRRLHHDLHDGLGPTLSHAVLALDGVRHRAPQELTAELDALKEGLRAAVDDLRATVQGLRPPALDDLGLRGVLRRHADLLAPTGLRVEVAVDTPGDLPAAVEVAAHRIATEALANVARHAHAGRCRVRVGTEDGMLLVEVVDDGVGPAGPPGVGRESMHRRAEELGGRTEILPGAPGTVVRARLPLDEGRG